MGKGLTILKIGGSVITCKNDEKRLREDTINQVVREIADARTDHLILVHGAGSFGHPQAAKHSEFGEDLVKNAFAVFDINTTVMELNTILVSSMISQGLPAVALHPMNFTILEDGRVHSMMTTQIEEMLDKGFIPVLHGDIVFDRKKGYAILSGDQIVTYLARDLQAQRVGLGVDVDGVIGSDGGVMEIITPQNVDEIIFDKGADLDVTGAMEGKVRELLELASYGISSCIFNGTKKGYIRRWLKGEKIPSTIISE
ncbi:MAG: hypothetical protein CW694_07280 [Candidatus Syntrophoarchaeum sp. WYZ-LMO15]|nr:MAG: hypothetical protein CW694_07280 [Candidatus Syntrophoarchaeum sp. WYZ-LMO15]